jgi:hypothetical protein
VLIERLAEASHLHRVEGAQPEDNPNAHQHGNQDAADLAHHRAAHQAATTAGAHRRKQLAGRHGFARRWRASRAFRRPASAKARVCIHDQPPQARHGVEWSTIPARNRSAKAVKDPSQNPRENRGSMKGQLSQQWRPQRSACNDVRPAYFAWAPSSSSMRSS